MKKKQKPIVETLAKPKPLTTRTAKLLRDEGHAWYHVLRYEWIYILMLAIGVTVLIVFWQPFPPKTLGIAVGREGTSDGVYTEKLVSFFAEHGVKLNVTYTEGGKQPIAVMHREDSIQSALVLGGLHKKHELTNVWSLGSSQYEPLWVFYRADTLVGDEPIVYFAKTGMAIGERGSGSNTIVHQILASGRKESPIKTKFLEWPYLKSVDALLAGEINALAAVDGIDLLFVGTHDLSVQLGIAGGTDKTQINACIERVVNAAKLNGKAVGLGGLAADPDALKYWTVRGVQFISVGSDLGFVMQGASLAVKQIKSVT